MSRQKQLKETMLTLPSVSLLGKRCWYVSIGSVDSTFQLALGEKVRRAEPLLNRFHSTDYRIYEGETNLLVWCTWRLRQNQRLVTSSVDLEDRAQRQLRKLVGCQVQEVHVTGVSWDLRIVFDDKRVLEVFCDRLAHRRSSGDDWELITKQKAMYVGSGGKVTVMTRGPETGENPAE
ncbi:hypothetical protein [Schlesneria sp. T3-172]|uniref:hypothetical protein n=1 Tax=Schlesneria sphaerica TaxID=3373610 RepID=UPI0037C5A42E